MGQMRVTPKICDEIRRLTDLRKRLRRTVVDESRFTRMDSALWLRARALADQLRIARKDHTNAMHSFRMADFYVTACVSMRHYVDKYRRVIVEANEAMHRGDVADAERILDAVAFEACFPVLDSLFIFPSA